MQHTSPKYNHERLLTELSTQFSDFKSQNIRAIYVYGSRLFGTSTINSDYDILIVHDNFTYNGDLSVRGEPKDDNNVYYLHDITAHVFIPHNQLLHEYDSQIGEELIEAECHISDTSLFIDLLRKHDGVVFFTVWM